MLPFDKLVQPIWEISHHPIAVVSFEVDPEKRRFLYFNLAFAALTGYSRPDAIGRPAMLLDGPKTDPLSVAAREDALKRGLPHDVTLIHYRKDGSEYLAQATVAPLVEPDGSADYLLWFETEVPSPHLVPGRGAAGDSGAVVPLVLPMPLKEIPSGQLPQHLTAHPDLDALKTLWITVRGDRILPHRKEFDLKMVAQWAAHISIVTVTAAYRFQFRLFGTELAAVYGRDLTGRFLDELAPRDLWSVVVLQYQEVVRTRQPLFAPVSIANGRWYNEVSRLLLPLADGDDDKVAFIMGADYRRVTY
jgi:PAS domain S-box-containing protein